MTNQIKSKYHDARQLGYPSKHALHVARTLDEWYRMEAAGKVRLNRLGFYGVRSSYFDGRNWQPADFIGMCVYADPLDWHQNWYVPGLMRTALDKLIELEEKRH